ncbi:dihydrolipoyllysine-residue acetyltransferase [bacterium]|nr:dihydrolipoyllysine-residue acetyltransferase [bacterium]
MATEFRLPELGENIDAASVTKVLVSVGDKIQKDQPVLELETDKATIEVPSTISGVVKEIRVQEGGKAQVGEVVLTIDSDGKAEAPSKPTVAPAEEKKPAEKKAEKKAESKPAAKTATAPKPAKAAVKKAPASGTVEFKIPELGENIEEASVIKVLAKPGDQVSKDQPLMELETDKATVEVPSSVSGVVKEVRIKEGDKAKVGDVVFVITASEEAEVAEAPAEAEAAAVEEVVEEEPKPAAEPKPKPRRAGLDEALAPVAEGYRKYRPDAIVKVAPAAPSVRRFSREIGIDINKVTGSGPRGRISIEDVKKYARSARTQKEVPSAGLPGLTVSQLPDFSKWGQIERKPMSGIRQKTAENMIISWLNVARVTQYDKADITELEEHRKKFGNKVEVAGGKLTVTAVLLKVVASALKTFPQFNASLDVAKNEIIYKKYYHVGVAVDTDRGLLVPVIRDVDKKNILQLSVDLTEAAEKARTKKLSLEEMQGGTFTITNLGGIGGIAFSPIVYFPQVAILGISRSSMEPVYVDGKFEPRLMLPLSLSYDHRLIDGADAARFLRWVAEALKDPFLIALEG